ncbi:MAG: iron complex outermembrane receptor protein [Halieaceae bacterium]|jgi:iron complex outermembrane receptor protein
MKTINQTKFVLSAMALAVASSTAHSQMLEEVIVTATKRAVGMQDVPIALSVMGSDKIAEQGITNLADIAVFMPNVHIAEATAGDQLFIRGIGSGINYGFEQSVGTFIDGVYFGRGQASRSAFLDVARVEVLKGSQSTLFGKNTIAGAINISTKKNDGEFEGVIEGTAEPEFGGQSISVILSGPITDNFGARFVAKNSETDGWMDNKFLDEDEVAKATTIARITLDWQPTDNMDVTFKYETGDSETTGANNVISIVTPTALAIYESGDPNFAQSSGFGYDKSEATFGGIRGGETYHDSEWDISTLTLEWDIGEYTIESITGYVDYEFDNYRDNDQSALIALARGRVESHKQFTQEFLLSSPIGETFEYLAGFYYQDEELVHDKYTDVSLSTLFFAGASLPAVTASGIADATFINVFNQDAETLSAFVQGTFHISDTVRVIGGLRYSQDEKEFDKGGIVTGLLTTGPSSDLLSAVYDGALNLATKHTFADGVAEVCPATPSAGISLTVDCAISPIDTQREENHVTGDLTVQWDYSDEVMLYGKYGNGYKAGGFDEDNTRGNIEAEEYEDETSESLEIGAKIDLMGGRGRLNVAIFHSEFEDVQVSTFDGNAGFVVGNAAQTEVDGIELDGMFAVTDDLTLSWGLAWLDAAYKSFPNAGCTNTQSQAFAAGSDGIAGTADDQTAGECTQDVSGNALQYSADVSGNVGISYFKSIGENLELGLSFDAMYSDDFNVAADGDELLRQDAFTKINARISIADIDGSWSIALLGKNLTDEKTSTWGNDAVLGGFGFAGTYNQIMEAPRSYEIQAKYSF